MREDAFAAEVVSSNLTPPTIEELINALTLACIADYHWKNARHFAAREQKYVCSFRLFPQCFAVSGYIIHTIKSRIVV